MLKGKLLTLDTIGDLDDGVVRGLVNAALEECLDDLDNRPALDKPRKLTIQLSLEPVLDKRGGLKGISAYAEVSKKIPPRTANADYCPTNVRSGKLEAHLPDDRQDAITFPAEEGN